LVKGILAHPGADLPRLVAADWLEEQSSTVPCPTCAMTGIAPGPHFTPISPGWDIKYRRVSYCKPQPYVILPPLVPKLLLCPDCKGSRCVPSGAQDHAKFIRDQIAGNVATMADGAMYEIRKIAPGVAHTSPTAAVMVASSHEAQFHFSRAFVSWVHSSYPWLQQHLPFLLKHHPIAFVGVFRWTPWHNGTGVGYSWWRESAWAGNGNPENQNGNIPDELFWRIGDLYPDARVSWDGPPDNQHLNFDHPGAANQAVSDTILARARRIREQQAA